ncbi:hypothetical protein [Chitinimonas koreensis]|uniref:hypothetical protein n=1 Tax=Chitinimonas koreensis TaxID=356302 RepID=UPI0012F9E91E|nr:hypothetical protein [Chitinimonas koreensis]
MEFMTLFDQIAQYREQLAALSCMLHIASQLKRLMQPTPQPRRKQRHIRFAQRLHRP